MNENKDNLKSEQTDNEKKCACGGWSCDRFVGRKINSASEVLGVKGECIIVTLKGEYWKSPNILEILKSILENVCPFNKKVEWERQGCLETKENEGIWLYVRTEHNPIMDK
jgi:hypothetical protein